MHVRFDLQMHRMGHIKTRIIQLRPMCALLRTLKINEIAVEGRLETTKRIFVVDGFGEMGILIGQLDLSNI